MEKPRPAPPRPEAAGSGPDDVAPDPAERPSAPRVAVHRCPFCHEGVRPEASVVCRDCLVRHHAACWSEGGRCASCQGDRRFEPEPLTLGTAVRILEDQGYDAEQVRALLAPVEGSTSRARESVPSLVLHRVILPPFILFLPAIIAGAVMGLTVEGALHWMSPAVKAALILGAGALGFIAGLCVMLTGPRKG